MTTPQEVRSVSTQIDCMVSNFDAPVDTSILCKAVSMLEELARLKEVRDEDVWNTKYELQTDSYATSRKMSYSTIINGSVSVEITNGSYIWKAKIKLPDGF